MAMITETDRLILPRRLVIAEAAWTAVIAVPSAAVYVMTYATMRVVAQPLLSHALALAAMLTVNLAMTHLLTYRGATGGIPRQAGAYLAFFMVALPLSSIQLWGLLGLAGSIPQTVEVLFGLTATLSAVAVRFAGADLWASDRDH